MKRVFVKTKTLICGLFPMEKFEIDEFEFKVDEVNDDILCDLIKENPFYLSLCLSNCIYTVVGEKKSKYNFFENKDYIELYIPNKKSNNKQSIINYILREPEVIGKISKLEQKLRFITNLYISLPITKIDVYNEDKEFLYTMSSFTDFNSINDDWKNNLRNKSLQEKRLKINIDYNIVKELCKTNTRYERALNLYNKSFEISDVSVRFVLMFSAFEAIFNISGEQITETVAIYIAKILYQKDKYEENYKKIKKLYNERSLYIHGVKSASITEEHEFELREYLRTTLLNYWFICLTKKFKDNIDILKFLDTDGKLDLQAQLFIKAFQIEDHSKFYSEIRLKLEKGDNNIV